MGRGGHNILSHAEKAKKGTINTTREKGKLELSVKPTKELLPPPPGYDKVETDLWNKTINSLLSMDNLFSQDYDIIKLYVDTIMRYEQAAKEVKQNGLTFSRETAHGTILVKNPAVDIVADCVRIIAMLSDKFGFSPRARMGIKVSGPNSKGEDDPFLRILKRKRN